MGNGKNGNIGAKMVDERKRSKPMKVKKYGNIFQRWFLDVFF